MKSITFFTYRQETRTIDLNRFDTLTVGDLIPVARKYRYIKILSLDGHWVTLSSAISLAHLKKEPKESHARTPYIMWQPSDLMAYISDKPKRKNY